MNTIIKDMEDYISRYWLEMPEDIRKLERHNKEAGKNFAARMFAYGDMNAGSYILHMLDEMCKEPEHFGTVKVFAEKYVRFHGNRFPYYYQMDEASALLLRAADAIHEAKDAAELSPVLAVTQRFFVKLGMWVDFSIPWAEATKAFDEICDRQKGLPD